MARNVNGLGQGGFPGTQVRRTRSPLPMLSVQQPLFLPLTDTWLARGAFDVLQTTSN